MKYICLAACCLLSLHHSQAVLVVVSKMKFILRISFSSQLPVICKFFMLFSFTVGLFVLPAPSKPFLYRVHILRQKAEIACRGMKSYSVLYLSLHAY